MLIEKLKTLRKKPVTNIFYPATYQQKKQLDHGTYLFRDRTIKNLVAAAGYKYGDTVRPSLAHAFEKEGCYKIVGIMNSWYDYKGKVANDVDVKWPDNNNPMIVLAMNIKTGTNIEATTNYFVKATEQEAKDAENSAC